VYDPGRNSLEENVNFPLEAGTIIADRYRIVEHLGSGVFSRAVQCEEMASGKQVGARPRHGRAQLVRPRRARCVCVTLLATGTGALCVCDAARNRDRRVVCV